MIKAGIGVETIISADQTPEEIKKREFIDNIIGEQLYNDIYKTTLKHKSITK